MQPVTEMAEVLFDQLSRARPAELAVEFGIALSAEAGAVITKSSVSGNLKVTMKWQREEPNLLIVDQLSAIACPGRTLMLVMRDDFYARLAAEAPALLDLAGPAVINIPATLTRAELHDIITNPAPTAGARLQDGLAERIIDDVLAADARASSTILLLLEVTLKRLWENRCDGVLTHEAYENFEGLRGSITSWCDHVVSGLPEPAVRTMLTMLVRPAEPEHHIPAVRRQRHLTDLRATAGDADAVLTGLITGRVIVTSVPQPDGEPVADLAHDALIDRWDTCAPG